MDDLSGAEALARIKGLRADIERLAEDGDAARAAGADPVAVCWNFLTDVIKAGEARGLLPAGSVQECAAKVLASSPRADQERDRMRFIAAAYAYHFIVDSGHQTNSRLKAAFDLAADALGVSAKTVERSYGNYRRSGGALWLDRASGRLANDELVDELLAGLPAARGRPGGR